MKSQLNRNSSVSNFFNTQKKLGQQRSQSEKLAAVRLDLAQGPLYYSYFGAFGYAFSSELGRGGFGTVLKVTQ